MAYSDFTLSEIKEKFQLSIEEQADIFSDAGEEKISDFLSEILKENIPLALAIQSTVRDDCCASSYRTEKNIGPSDQSVLRRGIQRR